jgi:hypothetical protein
MEGIDALRETLLWAAGHPTARFTLQPDQHETFLLAAKYHRLSGRLLRRLRSQPPEVTPQLVREAERLHEHTTTDTRKKIDLAARLGQAMRDDGRADGLILLKGFTLYALTGDPLTQRLMGDLDVNAADLDGFVDVARRLGFELVRPLNHLAEYAVLFSPADGFVELHSRFDVTSLPEGVTRDDFDPRVHDGVWEQRQHFRVRYIEHRDFQASLATSSVVADTVRPLGAEMAALMCAAHLFKNFLRYPYPPPFATLPLDEIATFVDLCRLPAFEASRFATLAGAFDGQTAVAFTRALARDLLGGDPIQGEEPGRLFPVNLWWDGVDGGGFPVDVGWDPRQLVYRDWPMRHVVEALGPTELSASGAEQTHAFRLLDGDHGGATRYIFRKDRDSTFVVDCRLSIGARGLRLRLAMPRVRDDRMVAIAVCFDDYRYEIFHNCRMRDAFTDYSITKDAAGDVTVDRSSSPDADVVELTLPSRIVESCRTDGCMYGFIVIREQVREWARMTAGAAVPLRIRIPS